MLDGGRGKCTVELWYIEARYIEGLLYLERECGVSSQRSVAAAHTRPCTSQRTVLSSAIITGFRNVLSVMGIFVNCMKILHE